jgi:hypothetical protein
MKFKYSLLVSFALATTWMAPAHAIDGTVDQIIDLVIQAADPSLAPAKPLIICAVAKGGGQAALSCMEEAAVKEAKNQAASAVPFKVDDPRIQLIIQVVEDIHASHWPAAVAHGGPVLVQTVVCAVLPLGGPAKGPACGVVGWVIKNNISVLDAAYADVKEGRWIDLIGVLGSPEVVCMFLPDEGVTAPIRATVCGLLGTVLAGAKDAVEAAWKVVSGGVNAIGDALSGQADAMPQLQYYALYWMPWYHYGTSLCAVNQCNGLSALVADEGRIWGPCKNYFDSHKYSSDNAKDICNGFRDRFGKEVKEYAKGLAAAADVYVQTMRPWARTWAVEDYDQNTLAQRKAFIHQNAEAWLRTKFPFPDPDPGRCETIKKAPLYAQFKPVYDQAYNQCASNANAQAVSPTVWSHVATEAANKFGAIINEENQALAAKLPKLLIGGCTPPPGWTGAQGLKFECDNYPGYQACLQTLSAGAELTHCHIDTAKVDAQIVKQILSAVGAKRCQANGLDVLCSRPWKVQKCGVLRTQLVAGGSSKVQCKEGPVTAVAAFAVEKTRAEKILNALNGVGQRRASDFSAKAAGPACKTNWDPLTLFCSDPAVAATVPQKVPGESLPKCGPDPNEDGADAPCLGGPWQVVAENAVQTAKPVAAALTAGLVVEAALQLLTRKGAQNVIWGATVQVNDADLVGVEGGQCRAGLHFDVRNLGPGASRPFDIRVDVNGQSAATRASGTLQAQGASSYDLYMSLHPGTNRVALFLGGAPARTTSGAAADAPTIILDVKGSCGGTARALPNAIPAPPAQRNRRQ